MTRPGLAAGLLLAAATLSGCATLAPPPRPAPAMGPWISGRLVVRVAATPQREASALSAVFELRGAGQQGEVALGTPLGTRLAQARWGASEAWLDLGRGEQRYADLDALSQAALGEVLPLRALPDWLAGRPWSGAPFQAVEKGFRQLGWTVSLAEWADARLLAERDEPEPRVVVRVQLEREGS